jgi:hypothetical protein
VGDLRHVRREGAGAGHADRDEGARDLPFGLSGTVERVRRRAVRDEGPGRGPPGVPEAGSINPEDPRAHLNLGWSHAARWQLEESFEALSRGIALDQYSIYSEQFIEKLKAVIEQRQTLEQTKQHYRTQLAY